VPRTKALTLDEFAAYVEAWPGRLGCWRDGARGQYPMLAWLNVRPIVEQRELASEVGHRAAAMMLTAQHHNQVGIAAGWITQYMTGPIRAQSSSEQDRVAMFETAGAYWALRNALVECALVFVPSKRPGRWFACRTKAITRSTRLTGCSISSKASIL